MTFGIPFLFLISSTFNFFNIYTMKKMYTFVSALVLGTAVQAQQLVDFETFSLSPESFENGSAGGGDFVFYELSFNNDYNAGWDYWEGFSVSNITDNTTPGWGNQYSAYPGSGSGGFGNYMMAYQSPVITGTTIVVQIHSFKITNSTYGALSMKDGDAVGKKFGSPNDANGLPDGTNGEDYFRVWAICEDAGLQLKDSIELYLADYRFADSTLDYIVDQWVDVNVYDSIAFPVNRITFRFESSDNGQFGMNTPAYFSLDDVEYAWPIGIEELTSSDIAVYPNPVTDQLKVAGKSGHLQIFDANGLIRFEGEHLLLSQVDCSAFAPGVYFLKLTSEEGSYTQRVVK